MGNSSAVIALMTDFGHEDVYVGVLKSVIASRSSARIIDLTHSVAPQNVHQAAYLLSTAYRFLPEGAVTLCVVDPGVGTDRTPIAVRWPGGHFVGPDNGWLSYVARDARQRDDGPGNGEVPTDWSVVKLEDARYRLPMVSRTFHGRDIFAPAAAGLAEGVPLEELGPRRETLATIGIPRAVDADGAVRGQVIHVDHFGNLITDIPASHLSDRFTITLGGGTIDGPADSYQSPEPLVALVGSSGHLEIAAPNGNAARLIMVGVGEKVTVVTRRTMEMAASA